MISKNKKKILVIGGGGYVGTLLVEKLVKLNYFVRVFDLFIYGNNIASSKNVEIIKGDIRFKNDISKICTYQDGIKNMKMLDKIKNFSRHA